MKFKIFLLIVKITFFKQFLLVFGEESLSSNEVLQYFSAAAGINSLILSFTNTVYSIMKLKELKKKNKGYNEGISTSIDKLKEHKSRNHVTLDSQEQTFYKESEYLINLQNNNNQSLLSEQNLTDIISDSEQLEEILMTNESNLIHEDNLHNERNEIRNIFRKSFLDNLHEGNFFEDSKENPKFYNANVTRIGNLRNEFRYFSSDSNLK